MSICVEKLPHRCGSSDGLQVFQNDDGEYSGYCFSCDIFENSPYGGTEQPSQRTQRNIRPFNEVKREIGSYHTVDLFSRKLSKSSLEYFNIKTSLSEQDGISPIIALFPYEKDGSTVAYKARLLADKKIWWIGEGKGCDLFGWKQALSSGSKKLFITEGEFDAVALFQALKNKQRNTQWAELNPAVVSISNGAGGAKAEITRHMSDIRRSFQEVILVFDNDEAGKKAEYEVMQILPTAATIQLPSKDPNACLLEGRELALANAVLFKASVPKNTRLVWGLSLHDAARQQAEWGLSWPWQGMTELTRGMRYGETYYLGAGVKMGKSELVNAIGAHLITEHGLKIFMAKPEESNRKTYQMLCGKIEGRIFHDPKIPFDFDAFDRASAVIGDNVCLLNLYQHLGWDSLRSDIFVAHQKGCRAVFIDPITNLVNGISSGETNTKLQEIAQELAALAKDLGIIILIFCHLKSPEAGPAHERGGKVMSHQFSGSRAMMRSCHLMVGLEGNKDPDLPLEERNLRRLVILEDREFGNTGVVNLYWDHMTALFNEIRTE